MAIRADFKEVEGPLNRLLVYGQTFDEFNCEKWPHYRNREDFERVYELSAEEQKTYEDLYSDGRDCSVTMSDFMGGGFNDVRRFPTLRSYVAAFEGGWVHQTDELKARLAEVVALREKHGKQPWSVRAMVDLHQKQIEMLEAAAVVLAQLKNTPLYRREGGEPEPAAGGTSGHWGFVAKCLAALVLLVLAVFAIKYLGFWSALVFVAFAVLVLPPYIAFSSGADKMTGGDLVAIYKSGVQQLPGILKGFGKGKPKP